MWVILGQAIEKVHMVEIEPEPGIDAIPSRGQQGGQKPLLLFVSLCIWEVWLLLLQ